MWSRWLRRPSGSRCSRSPGEEITQPSWHSAIAALYLAFFGSVIAFSAFVYLIANVRPSLAMSYAYVNPIIAVVLGAIFYDEVVSANLLMALPLVVLGVGSSPARRRRPPHAMRPTPRRAPDAPSATRYLGGRAATVMPT